MNYQMMNARNYLARFDQILNEMSNKMLNARPTNNITKYFIECMVPHHQAAIYMCENLLRYTRYQPLRRIANDIIRMQTRGIEQMREIARTTYGYENFKKDVEEYTEKYLKIVNRMIEKMANSPRSVNINWDFVNEMIPHHEGAIEMCQNLLQYRIDPRLRAVAETIIREQSNGVVELKEIRRRLNR